MENDKKFCKHCGERIDKDCVICPKCGKQVEELAGNDKNIIINNNNSASSAASASSTTVVQGIGLKTKNKWVAFFLCLCLGIFGAHKFYEGKIIFGLVYLFTLGFCGIGVLIDLILIILKPNPYFV